MLTRARSLISRVFSFDTPTSQIRVDETFDSIDGSVSDDNNVDNTIDYEIKYSTNSIDNDDDGGGLSDSGNKSSHFSLKRQTNDYCNNAIKSKSNLYYKRSHEQSRQNRLISEMQMATSRCNIESMKRLLNCFDIDINHRDRFGMNYLEHAILMGSFNMVDLLVRYGCDLYQGNSNGHSYLYVAIETTTNKSLAIIRLLLESNCACLSSLDIISFTSPIETIYINSQDFLLLNTYLLFIFKYHIRRMVLNDVLNLISYLILTNLLLCKNEEHYGLELCNKMTLNQFNNDYISLFVKTLGTRHALKLEHKLQNLQTLPSTSLIPITTDDIHLYINRIEDLTKQVPGLKHLCRLLIRRNLKNLKRSTIKIVIPPIKLQEYLLYTPI